MGFMRFEHVANQVSIEVNLLTLLFDFWIKIEYVRETLSFTYEFYTEI